MDRRLIRLELPVHAGISAALRRAFAAAANGSSPPEFEELLRRIN